MWWPIRNQILVPFVAVLFVGVTTIAAASAYLSARSSERATIERLNQVAQTLGSARFPYTENVLVQMRGLSGAEFVALDKNGHPVATTIGSVSDPELASLANHSGQRSFPAGSFTIAWKGRRFLASAFEREPSVHGQTLVALYPMEQWNRARWEAAAPSLFVGALTLVLMAGVAVWIAGRLNRRVKTLQRQVERIAEGDFLEIELTPPHDELGVLASAVNRMSARLRQMQQTIRRSERTRLLGQLAGGLAHQFRNAVTGLRMAVEIHQRRCPLSAQDESLAVALRQLHLSEEQLRRLLAVGRDERSPAVPATVADLVADVTSLVEVHCRHVGIRFETQLHQTQQERVADGNSTRTALLNLLLNAFEAAGPGGSVALCVQREQDRLVFVVSDDGPGPPAELADELFEPFVTGRNDGVGLGLALVAQVAERCGGRVTWYREAQRTCFRLELPARQSAESVGEPNGAADLSADERSGEKQDPPASQQHAASGIPREKTVPSVVPTNGPNETPTHGVRVDESRVDCR